MAPFCRTPSCTLELVDITEGVAYRELWGTEYHVISLPLGWVFLL